MRCIGNVASLKKNFAYQTAYQLLIILLPFITSPYLSRVIGAQGLGEYSYSYSVAYYFSLFILLGINNHGTREIAKVKNDLKKRSEVFLSLYCIQAIMGIIVFLLYYFTQVYGNDDALLSKIQLLYVLSAFLDINWFFFGLEKFKITVTRNFVVKLMSVICIFVFVKDVNDTAVYTTIMAFGLLGSQILLWPFVLKEIKPTLVKKELVLANVKPLLILFIPVVAASIFKYMDKIMLGYMCSKVELAFYDNSEKIMSIPTGLITAVGTVMLPRISSLMNDNDDAKVKTYIRNSLIGSMMAASALAFGLAAIAPTFAPWFWGENFAECGTLIAMISVTVLFLSWANIFRTQYLIPNGMDTVFVKATIYGAIINFVINLMLIKPLGAKGTVIGTVVAEFIVAFYQTIKCRKMLPVRDYFKDSLPYIVMGIFMYGVVYSISRLEINSTLLLIIEILCGATVYSTMCIVYLLKIKKIKLETLVSIVRGR